MSREKDVKLSIRLSAAQVAKLDGIAGAAGASRSTIIRRLLDGADDLSAPASKPLDRQGVLDLLSEQARNGSTASQRLLLDELREDAADEHLRRLRELTT